MNKYSIYFKNYYCSSVINQKLEYTLKRIYKNNRIIKKNCKKKGKKKIGLRVLLTLRREKKERRWVLNRYLIDVSAVKQPNHLYLYLLSVLNEWLLDYVFLCVRCLNSIDQAHGQEKGSLSLSHTHRRTVAHNYTSRRRVGYELALL